MQGEEGSGLRALEVAARTLQRGEADVMLAGAVDLAGDLRKVLGTDGLRPFARDGAPLPFDEASPGAAVGEGAAAVVLKRLSDAQAHGDRIYAVIRGFGAAGRHGARVRRVARRGLRGGGEPRVERGRQPGRLGGAHRGAGQR